MTTSKPVFLITKRMVRISIKWGVILGVALVIGTQILTWLGLGTSNWFIVLTYVLVITAVLLCTKELKRKLLEDFSFLKSFLSVLIVILISRYIFQAYMYVYINFVDPNWIETISEKWTIMLQEKNLSTDQIKNQISRFQKSYEPLNMFTIEIIYIGLSQFILGCVATSLYLWRAKK
tara:strand:- start:460 stop:990 length:531 start_codon:yes stop_codon:yes gene_type:complete